MMQFTFDIPVKFERIFNFTNPELSLNYYWFDTKNIERFEPNIKQTLVKSLTISFLASSILAFKFKLTLYKAPGLK